MSRRRKPPAWASLAAALGLWGCGGGVPLMHPAHTLPSGQVTMGSGVSGQFVVGEADRKIDAAREVTAPQGAVQLGDEEVYAEGAIATAALGPGVAPWVGARAGVGYDADAGVTYTGRSVRIDGRRAFISESVALSLGLGASGLLNRPGSDSDRGRGNANVPGLDTGGVTGWGLDLPVLVGWRSTADLIQVYAGLRAGHERLFGDFELRIDPSPDTVKVAPVDVGRWWGGGLLGLAVSIEPVMGIIEISGSVHRIEGSVDIPDGTGKPVRYSVEVVGLALTPGAALVGEF